MLIIDCKNHLHDVNGSVNVNVSTNFFVNDAHATIIIMTT